jgi:hypothetical protein
VPLPHSLLTLPDDGAINIMRWPMAEGQVLHRDEEQVVLEDPVLLPDGQQGRRQRLVTGLGGRRVSRARRVRSPARPI